MRAMKLSTTGLLCVLTLGVAGCGLSVAEQSRKAEQDYAASCRRDDADVEKAAHPDAATIARHDRLVQKAADLNAAAVAQHLQGAALDAATATIAQFHIEADALYDAQGKQQIANQCWAMLGVVRETHYEMRQRILRAADEIDAQQRSTPALMPSASTYAPVSQPPTPPAPNPVGTLDNLYSPPSPKTWGETPYAPMIPPVMRDQPVENVNPMIPPAARDLP
jgi:hypothetical protein